MDFNFSLCWHGDGRIRHSNAFIFLFGILFSLLRGIWVFIILYTIYWTMECFTLYLIQVNLSFIGQSNPNQVFKWISVSYDSFLFKICQPLKNIVKKKKLLFSADFQDVCNTLKDWLVGLRRSTTPTAWTHNPIYLAKSKKNISAIYSIDKCTKSCKQSSIFSVTVLK